MAAQSDGFESGLTSVLRVVLTGSECTGKTTTAVALAARYGTLWVPESARVHADRKGSPLTLEDVDLIARLHIEAADAAEESAEKTSRPLLFLDTDLVSTVVYSRHYYGTCPAWIEKAARTRRADLYLLHHPDIPWLADPSRDRGHLRREMHALFCAALREFGVHAADVMGHGEAREAAAAASVEALLRLPGGSGG